MLIIIRKGSFFFPFSFFLFFPENESACLLEVKCHSFIYLDLILEVLLVTLFEYRYSSTTQGGMYF